MTEEKTFEEKKQYNEYYAGLIVDIARNQSKQSFKEIYQEFYPRIKSYLRTLNAGIEHIDDLAQDIMTNIWRKAYQYDAEKAAPITWIFTMTRNRFIDAHIRKKTYNFTQEDACFFMNDIENPYHNIERINKHTRIVEMVKKLPKEQMDLIRMAYFEEKTHQEISEITQMPLGTIKSKLRKALDTLKRTGKLDSLKD